jgi:isoamylase
MIFNAHTEKLEYKLPDQNYGLAWKLVVDTSKPSADDLSEAFNPGQTVAVESRSVLLLQSPLK